MLRIRRLSGEDLACFSLSNLSDVKALKQRLHEQHGLPPRFRQRLLYEGKTLDDADKLNSVLDRQVVAAAAALASVMEPQPVAWMPSAPESEQSEQAAATERDSASMGVGALKRQLTLEDKEEMLRRLRPRLLYICSARTPCSIYSF